MQEKIFQCVLCGFNSIDVTRLTLHHNNISTSKTVIEPTDIQANGMPVINTSLNRTSVSPSAVLFGSRDGSYRNSERINTRNLCNKEGDVTHLIQ